MRPAPLAPPASSLTPRQLSRSPRRQTRAALDARTPGKHEWFFVAVTRTEVFRIRIFEVRSFERLVTVVFDFSKFCCSMIFFGKKYYFVKCLRNKLVGCFVILSTKRLVVIILKLAEAAVCHSKSLTRSEY